MQRRSFFKALALVAGYCGIGAAQAHQVPTITKDPLEVQTISAGPPAGQDRAGPLLVHIMDLGFIIPSYGYMAARFNSEFTVDVSTGEVLKNRGHAQYDGRYLKIGEYLEIAILDGLVDAAVPWPTLDLDDPLNGFLGGPSRKVNQWVPQLRSALYQGGDVESRIRAFHAASRNKTTHYGDWPV